MQPTLACVQVALRERFLLDENSHFSAQIIVYKRIRRLRCASQYVLQTVETIWLLTEAFLVGFWILFWWHSDFIALTNLENHEISAAFSRRACQTSKRIRIPER